MHLLVMNVGSSSIKYAVFEERNKLFEKNRQRIFTAEDRKNAVREIHDWLIEQGIEISAIGQRVVHGGGFNSSCELTPEIIDLMKGFNDLAPLHNPPIIQAIEACRDQFKGIKQYGVFDTSFYADMPEVAKTYGIPYEYFEQGIKRYGFHGTSHRFVSRDLDGRVVSCHLGNGASVTAILDGRAMDTTMGFTPLEGLLMGTRCGDIDAAIVEYLVKTKKMTLDEVFNVLQKQSGLLGVSGGISNDCWDIEQSDTEGAKRALNLFSYKVTKYVGAYSAVLNGIDHLVFTAGIGEKSPIIRGIVCSHFTSMGMKIDDAKNQKNERIISTPDSAVKVHVIPTDENLMIVEDVLNLHK
jgi:acetate kinase